MQYQFSCLPKTYDGIEDALSPARLARYLPAAKASNGDRHLALRLYVWNARLCEAMYFPLQIAEIAVRNAVEKSITKRFGDRWHENAKFVNLLPKRMKTELTEVIRKSGARQNGLTAKDDIVANLTFGFWVSLMTRSFENHLWVNGISQSFTHSKATDTRETIHKSLEEIRIFRNKIMHHHPIFDKNPQAKFQQLLFITKLICLETHWLMSQISTVNQTINTRPSC